MRLLILILTLICLTVNVSAQSIDKYDLTTSQYKELDKQLYAKGYRVVSITGYELEKAERLSAIWEKKNDKISSISNYSMTADDLLDAFALYDNLDYHISYITSYIVNGQQYFATIGESNSTADYKVFFDMSYRQYTIKSGFLKNAGYRMTFLNGYVVDNVEYYTAIFENTAVLAWEAYVGMTADQYRTKYDSLIAQGYQLLVVSGYGNDSYAAIWEKNANTPPFWISLVGVDRLFATNVFDNLRYQGFYAKYVHVFVSSTGIKYSTVWQNSNVKKSFIDAFDIVINDYMQSQNVTGLSFALTKNERLVFAKGYGIADKLKNEPLSPNHAMRTMSVSKILTGVGIMKLIESGKLSSLDCKVFGMGGVLGFTYHLPEYNKIYLKQITIRMLLVHGAGLKNVKDDERFMNSSLTRPEVMNDLLNDNDLFFARPSTEILYSNAGYFILGRVIEELSGVSYESYIQKKVLSKLEMDSTFIGKADGTEKRPLEVRYNPSYTPNMQLWEAFNGWVSTPVDLVRLMVRIDRYSNKTDILDSDLLEQMTTNNWGSYGVGVRLSGLLYGQNGCAGPSRSLLWRYRNRVTYSALINSKPINDSCANLLQTKLEAAIDLVKLWPTHDLFLL
jgi:CubicO group peptidase (beta-lactamase class C family)